MREGQLQDVMLELEEVLKERYKDFMFVTSDFRLVLDKLIALGVVEDSTG